MINQDQMTNFLIRLDADEIRFEQYVQFCEDMQNQWTAEAGIADHLDPAAFDLHDRRWNEIRDTSLDTVYAGLHFESDRHDSNSRNG